jgi:hypothetical protein
MVQSTESREGVNLAFSHRADCGWPARWRILREPEMSSAFVVIEDVRGQEPLEMLLMQDDYVVQQVS